MTAKTFTMTMAQMRAMFEAGVRAGESSACAYNAGGSYYGSNSDFVEAVEEVVNEGKKWGEDGHVAWDDVEAMVKEG